MRKEMKIAWAIGLVLIVVVGWYYIQQGSRKDVPLASSAPPPAGEVTKAGGADTAATRSPSSPQVAMRTPSPAPKRTATDQINPPSDSISRTAETPPVAPPPGEAVATRSGIQADEPVGAAMDTLFGSQAVDGTRDNDAPSMEDGSAIRDATDSTVAGGSPSTSTDADRGAPLGRPATPGPSSTGQSPSGRGETAVETHTVSEGDTFASLAEMYYGSQKFAAALIAANPQITSPENLPVGVDIRIPPLAPETAAKPAPVLASNAAKAGGDERYYEVQAGDTFYAIASRTLGAGTRWPEIFELNKDLVRGDPRNLRIGQRIRLPETVADASR